MSFTDAVTCMKNDKHEGGHIQGVAEGMCETLGECSLC